MSLLALALSFFARKPAEQFAAVELRRKTDNNNVKKRHLGLNEGVWPGAPPQLWALYLVHFFRARDEHLKFAHRQNACTKYC
jgi:hypothetical protein